VNIIIIILLLKSKDYSDTIR